MWCVNAKILAASLQGTESGLRIYCILSIMYVDRNWLFCICCLDKTLRIPGHSWEDNIKMDHKQMCREGVEWIAVAENRRKWRAVVDTNDIWG
jgi:hypothetical protein